jgi:hypothetical protein
VEKLGLNAFIERYHVASKSSKVDLNWLETPFDKKTSSWVLVQSDLWIYHE